MINGLKNAGITLDRKSLRSWRSPARRRLRRWPSRPRRGEFAVKSAKNAEKAVASKAANAKAAARA